MNKKFGVIIQGPIISYGSGGRNDNPEGFDSTDTIKENISRISKHIPINNIVFSGWSSDSGIHVENIKKIFSKDPYSFDYLNQKRQFYTIKKGFDYLSSDNEIEYFIKIRTDQLLPNIFWEWITQLNQKLDNQVLVSEFYNNSPFVFGDFVICSSKENFNKFINSQELKRHSINGARNMVLKYLNYVTLKRKIEFSKNYLLNDFKLVFKFDQLHNIWIDYITSSFFSIPLNIFKEIDWRGIRMDTRFENLDQIFIYNTVYKEKHTFMLFKTEYFRYFSFVKNHYKKEIKKLLFGSL